MSILSEYDNINMDEKHRRHLTRLDIDQDSSSFNVRFSKLVGTLRSGSIRDMGKVPPGIYLIVGPFPDKHSIRCWGYCGDMVISHAGQKYEHEHRINVDKHDLDFMIEKLGPGSWVRIVTSGHSTPDPWNNHC